MDSMQRDKKIAETCFKYHYCDSGGLVTIIKK